MDMLDTLGGALGLLGRIGVLQAAFRIIKVKKRWCTVPPKGRSGKLELLSCINRWAEPHNTLRYQVLDELRVLNTSKVIQ